MGLHQITTHLFLCIYSINLSSKEFVCCSALRLLYTRAVSYELPLLTCLYWIVYIFIFQKSELIIFFCIYNVTQATKALRSAKIKANFVAYISMHHYGCLCHRRWYAYLYT